MGTLRLLYALIMKIEDIFLEAAIVRSSATSTTTRNCWEVTEMPEINKDLLLHRILHSGDFTALEKRYLENLVGADENPTSSSKGNGRADASDYQVH